MGTKPLTDAQQQHLSRLNTTSLQAKQNMDAFVGYLRAEHDAPAEGWQLRNLQVGFERMPEKPKGESDETKA